MLGALLGREPAFPSASACSSPCFCSLSLSLSNKQIKSWEKKKSHEKEAFYET